MRRAMPYRRGCYATFVAGTWVMLAPAVGLAESPLPTKADAIRKWIVAPTEMKPGVRKPSYDKTPKDDLDAVVGYLPRLGAAQ